MCARPSRASSGPSSSTDPRSRPTSARSGACLRRLRRANAQRRAADAVDLCSDVEQQPRHHLDVANAWHVRQDAFVLGQQTCREQGQRGVLVAFDGHAPLQSVSAFYEQCRHESSCERACEPRTLKRALYIRAYAGPSH